MKIIKNDSQNEKFSRQGQPRYEFIFDINIRNSLVFNIYVAINDLSQEKYVRLVMQISKLFARWKP